MINTMIEREAIWQDRKRQWSELLRRAAGLDQDENQMVEEQPAPEQAESDSEESSSEVKIGENERKEDISGSEEDSGPPVSLRRSKRTPKYRLSAFY